MVCIDIHTHMMNRQWITAISNNKKYGQDKVGENSMIALAGRPYMPIEDEMLDYEKRIIDMDLAGVDIAIISLTTPSVYWANKSQAINLSKIINDEMAAKQSLFPDRIRFFATLPWQYPKEALKELSRAVDLGAIGVFVGATIEGLPLIDKSLAIIWRKIDELALPVLLHPGPPTNDLRKNIEQYNLIQSVGFMCDTTIAVTSMIFDGFFDRYSNLKLIAAHVGGTLPYISGRLDACYNFMSPCREKISVRPTEYLRHIYYDSIGFSTQAIQMCIDVGGSNHVMFGSDYPHLIGHMQPAKDRVKALPNRYHEGIFNRTAINVFRL